MHVERSCDAVATSTGKPRVRVTLDVEKRRATESAAAPAGMCSSMSQAAVDQPFRQTSAPVPFDRKLSQLERAVALLREQVLQICANQDGLASSSVDDGQHADGAGAFPEESRRSDTFSIVDRDCDSKLVHGASCRQPRLDAEMMAMPLPAFHPQYGPLPAFNPQYGYVLQPVYTAPAIPMPVCNPCGQDNTYQSSAESLPHGARPLWPAAGPHSSSTCGLPGPTPGFGGCFPSPPMPVAAQPWPIPPNANAAWGTWPSGWPPIMLQQPRPLQEPRERLRSQSNCLPPWDSSRLQKDSTPGPAHYTPKLPPACRSFNSRFTADPENPGYGEFSAAPLAPRPVRRGKLGSMKKSSVGGSDATKEIAGDKGSGK
uniref:Uncharacterized protein n=1 Tax=Chrysotila carterae TaxID=13221 RepID=A0A7S4C256_CHRCT|mmetsp:Transcript_4791/g.10433  ORF Transcript_4791/g.10433 Transcript_4791/m.10433 type:complete len:372 (-) Transcript_4791:326-1441(-)